jgi:hypothetical protein
VELVEVTLEGELFFSPDTLEALNEFLASSVSLTVIQPPLTDTSEL